VSGQGSSRKHDNAGFHPAVCGFQPRQAARHCRPVNHSDEFAMQASLQTSSQARQAGQSAAQAAAATTAREVLSFKLGAEEYGIDILKVQEIRGYEPPTRIANAPHFIKGVVNLRGVIVPVVDMRLRFGMDDAQYNAFTVVIILNVAGRTVGMVVDSVSDVLELDPGQIRPAPEFNSNVDASTITGLGTVKSGDAERMLILIDIEAVMAGADMGLVESGFTH
jgi:purine-binding chemotaxis protein CheW